LASTGTRRPRKAKKAVLVIDAIAQAPEPVAEPEVAPAKPKRARSAPRPTKATEAAPVSAAHRALLAALAASAAEPEPTPDDEGVVYTPTAPRAEPSLHSGPMGFGPELDELIAPEATEAEAAGPFAPAASEGGLLVAPSEKVGLAARIGLGLRALDGLPPIRLPLGPSIPWRFGVPGLVALVAVMLLLGRPTAHAESSNSNTFKLPAESETYAVTQDSPLFAKTQQQQAETKSIGVAEPAGLNVDVLDLSLKLVAVLALAYGSLVLLKRLGIGGAGSGTSGSHSSSVEGLRVISTLALAPNRSIHVVRAPDGKTLLLGATPGQVNLIAELGDVPDVETGGSGSFLDILTSKLQ
jgi:flagellar biogenesis protein FliO